MIINMFQHKNVRDKYHGTLKKNTFTNNINQWCSSNSSNLYGLKSLTNNIEAYLDCFHHPQNPSDSLDKQMVLFFGRSMEST